MNNNRIAQLRLEKNLSQQELAKILDISRASLSHYESCRREPDIATLEKMADYFQTSIDYIVNRSPLKIHSPDLHASYSFEDLSQEDQYQVISLIEHFRKNKKHIDK